MNIKFSKKGNYFDTGAIDPLSHLNSLSISSGLWIWGLLFEISKASQGIALGFGFGMVGLLLFSEEFIANINLDVWLIVIGVPLMVIL